MIAAANTVNGSVLPDVGSVDPTNEKSKKSKAK